MSFRIMFFLRELLDDFLLLQDMHHQEEVLTIQQSCSGGMGGRTGGDEPNLGYVLVLAVVIIYLFVKIEGASQPSPAAM